MNREELVIRPKGPEDRSAVIALAGRALGWDGDQRDSDFFAWKHEENPFGDSPAWVAELNGEIVGFRALMRWEFGRADRLLRVVRAVDTATDPALQGRGIFRRLTLRAVDALTADGYDAVFNTPNDQSLPGYLKMGWTGLGRPALRVHPRGLVSVSRMARSRVAAEKWSESVAIGAPAGVALSDAAIESLVASLPPPQGWATPRSLAFLRWRYGFEPLNYRVVEVRDGVIVFRVRRRGAGREVAVCEWLARRPDPRAVRRVIRSVRADYAVAIGIGARAGFLPLPRQGPIVTWRPLAWSSVPQLTDIKFTLGDLELL